MDSFEVALKKFQKQFADMKDKPSEKEIKDAWDGFHQQILGSAKGMLAQVETLGLELPAAEIKLNGVSAENPYQREGPGGLEGMESGPLRVTLEVKSDKKSKAGNPITGYYVVTAARVKRGADRWNIEDKIRWERFPDGLLGQKERADLEFENYVSEYRALPPGTPAPAIEFVRLDNEAKGKLSEFRGKVLLLEWWATWCGPCQEPMAHLQTLRAKHPEWKDKVEIVALSIDDGVREVRQHLEKRGWTNSFNAWAGPGGWKSSPAKQFRVSSVPTCYVIDAKGKVVQAGFPMGLDLTNIVAELIR